MVNVQADIFINVPREDVAGYAANPDNTPSWYENITSATWLTAPPLAEGSRLAFGAKFLGRTLKYTYHVIKYDAGIVLVMRTSQGPFPMQTTYLWADEAGGTRMTLRNVGEPSGFGILAGAAMAPMMRRAMRKDLAKLKSLLETV